MDLALSSRMIEWRGPSPFFLPVKQAVRKPQGLTAGDEVAVSTTVRL